MAACSISNCGRPSKANGLCNTHNERRRRGRDLERPVGPYVSGSVSERVAALVPHGAVDECWEWAGLIGRRGYGVLNVARAQKYAHRLVYELTRGSIPVVAEADQAHGTVIMHTCDNRKCVNPAHLVAGTQRDNLQDMGRKGRQWRSKLRTEPAVPA